MAAGSKIELHDNDRKRIADSVETAENLTGLEFLVFIGNGLGNSRRQVARALQRRGVSERPGVIIGLLGRKLRVEIVSQEAARERVSDDTCRRAIAAMVPELREQQWASAIAKALSVITEAAGPGAGTGTDLPNLLG